MSFKVIYSDTAKGDLRSIYEYIAFKLSEPLIASSQTKRIMEAVRSLDEMPARYRLYDNEPWRSRGLRVVPIDNYLVFYTIDDESETVRIIRIMYGGRDIKRQLNDNTEI